MNGFILNNKQWRERKAKNKKKEQRNIDKRYNKKEKNERKKEKKEATNTFGVKNPINF